VIFVRNEMGNDLGTAAMLIGLKACAKDVEEKIQRIHEDPAPLEAGKLTIGSVRGTAPGAM
jgi:hypothetical protein